MFLPKFPITPIKRVILISPLPEWNFFSKQFSSKGTYRWLNFTVKRLNEETSLLGPLFGAPQLAFTLEVLLSHGLKEVLFIGWAGKTPYSPLSVGTLFLPIRSISLTGSTWFYYKHKKIFTLNQKIKKQIEEKLQKYSITYQSGVILSVDSPNKVESDLERYNFYLCEVDAVDMETSTLFALANYYNFWASALVMLTDEVGIRINKRPEHTLKELRIALLPLLEEFLKEGLADKL